MQLPTLCDPITALPLSLAVDGIAAVLALMYKSPGTMGFTASTPQHRGHQAYMALEVIEFSGD